MSYNRPTLAELIQRARSDVLSRMPREDVLRRADGEVSARVFAGGMHGLYGYVDWTSRQMLPDTADLEVLERHASIWGVARKPAVAATGNVTFTVQVGAVIPAGTLMQALDGQQYQTTADAAVTAPTATAPVEALEPGAAGNRSAGEVLTLVSPVLGVQSQVVAGEMSGGADIESEDELRARLLDRIRMPPHGGSANDYVTWAQEVEGVTRAWVYAGELGNGTVTVRFVRDNDASPIPDAAAVASVQAYIDQLKPVTADVFVVAPIPKLVHFVFDRITPNTQAVRDAIAAELADLVLREAEPGGKIPISHIRASISAAAGEADYVMSSPLADLEAAAGEMLVIGSVTWPA